MKKEKEIAKALSEAKDWKELAIEKRKEKEKQAMTSLKKGQFVIFSAMCELTGQAIELQGTVVGNYLDVRKKWPLEMAEAEEGMFLVHTKGLYNSSWHAIHISEVLHREVEQ